ncbi:MAG: guanylate kinase [Synergistaceae bacterium]|nr:guanylate kinase [Synergistaceae bacterium]
MKKRGNLLVVSGPAGVGKGTVLRSAFEKLDGMCYSISCTTREPRPNLDIDGITYYFLTKEDFATRISQNCFLEYAVVHGNFYGTPRDKVLHDLNNGLDVVLEIDVQGALMVKQKMPDAKLIFFAPPSEEELERRLRSRGTEDESTIKLRLKNARWEMNQIDKYDYKVVNDSVTNATEKFIDIVKNIRRS